MRRVVFCKNIFLFNTIIFKYSLSYFLSMAEKRLKMAVIAGAAEALKVKNSKRYITDEQVMQKVTENADAIAEKIDIDEFE